jgi:hypothetical protein
MKKHTEQELSELKQKFFAQYYKQEVAFIPSPYFPEGDDLIRTTVDRFHEIKFLELKPLSSISDEDLEFIVVGICGLDRDEFLTGKNKESVGNFLNRIIDFDSTDLHICDFLRSKGYAIPWMGFSVDELIELGWVKLIEP